MTDRPAAARPPIRPLAAAVRWLTGAAAAPPIGSFAARVAGREAGFDAYARENRRGR